MLCDSEGHTNAQSDMDADPSSGKKVFVKVRKQLGRWHRSCYQGCYQSQEAACSSRRCPLFQFSGIHQHLWKPSPTGVETPEFGLLWAKHLKIPLRGFDGSLHCGNWCRTVKASVSPQLWSSTAKPTNEKSFKTQLNTCHASEEGLLKISECFFFINHSLNARGSWHKRALWKRWALLYARGYFMRLNVLTGMKIYLIKWLACSQASY